jgi:hypothetical protein
MVTLNVIDVVNVESKTVASTIQRLSPGRVKLPMSQAQANLVLLRESMKSSNHHCS